MILGCQMPRTGRAELMVSRVVKMSSVGTSRSATATSTETSPQNITLLYYIMSFAIIPSCSRDTLLAKYPTNELVPARLFMIF